MTTAPVFTPATATRKAQLVVTYVDEASVTANSRGAAISREGADAGGGLQCGTDLSLWGATVAGSNTPIDHSAGTRSTACRAKWYELGPNAMRFRRKTGWALIAAGLGGCSPQAPAWDASVWIDNQSGRDICTIRVSTNSDLGEGIPRNVKIPAGAQAEFLMPKGEYDLIAEHCEERASRLLDWTTIDSGDDWVVRDQSATVTDAQLAWSKQDWPRLQSLLERSVQQGSSRAAHVDLGLYDADIGRFDEAARNFEAALLIPGYSLDPALSDAAIFRQLARVQRLGEHPTAAKKAAAQAAKVLRTQAARWGEARPTNALLGVELMRAGGVEEAKELIENVLSEPWPADDALLEFASEVATLTDHWDVSERLIEALWSSDETLSSEVREAAPVDTRATGQQPTQAPFAQSRSPASPRSDSVASGRRLGRRMNVSVDQARIVLMLALGARAGGSPMPQVMVNALQDVANSSGYETYALTPNADGTSNLTIEELLVMVEVGFTQSVLALSARATLQPELLDSLPNAPPGKSADVRARLFWWMFIQTLREPEDAANGLCNTVAWALAARPAHLTPETNLAAQLLFEVRHASGLTAGQQCYAAEEPAR